MKKVIYVFITIVLLTLLSCKQQPENVADSIYYGGDIITMEGDTPQYAEAVAVKEGKILFVGPKDEAMKFEGSETKVVDLQGKTMLPGFIDPHSHIIMQSAKFACVNLDPYPIGDVKTIADIQRKLRERINEKEPKPGTVIVGWGYDDTSLEEMRHPNRDDLDAVSTEFPILLIHISAHIMTSNSKALEMARVTSETPNPSGGVIQRRAGSNVPNGVFEEQAMLSLAKILPMPSAEDSEKLIAEGLKKYAAEGITTCQDGATFPGGIKLLRKMQAENKLPIDVVAYPLYKGVNDTMLNDFSESLNNMTAFRVGGIKLVLDGSIQGYTAYLSKPYYVQPGSSSEVEQGGCENEIGNRLITGQSDEEISGTNNIPTKGYRGYAGMQQEEIEEWVKTADEHGLQILAHCNGDAAIDMLIEALKKVREDKPRPDLRTVIIHSQTIRDDQMDYAAANGLILSFFPIHVEFWGDRHRDLFLGPERAERIDPSNTALKKGIKITLHHDAPVAHWGMLPVISSAVNRMTSSGKLLGADEGITPFQALCAVTRDAAFQYSEENLKGTLKEGKLADFVILNQNPIKIDPMKIMEIKVEETIKEGKTVYKKS